MTGRVALSVGVALVAAAAAGARVSTAAAQASVGTIKGRVHLTGKSPGNTVIRMGVDPMCAKVNAGKRVIQEEVITSADGGLSNAFVHLQGTFPRVAAPSAEPVVIDQRSCVYGPRVVGAQVGQTLLVRNSDPLLHNVHSLSAGTNGFNVAQPMAGMENKFPLKNEEIMLRLTCDLHRWMRSYIGVVSHPYFAVSGAGGTFEIAKVPVGTHTIETWHERYGTLTRPVRVTAGATVTVDFPYTGAEKPPAIR